MIGVNILNNWQEFLTATMTLPCTPGRTRT